jgi:HSP20 family molecular chaperone IbpA
MLFKHEYDVVVGANNSTIIDIAVPGLRKEDLECSMVDSEYLKIRTISEPAKQEYQHQGIRKFLDEKIYIGADAKVDMITCYAGILSILISEKIKIPNKIVIQ